MHKNVALLQILLKCFITVNKYACWCQTITSTLVFGVLLASAGRHGY